MMRFPYSDEEIRRRLRLGEDSSWEFKAVEFRGDSDRPQASARVGWAEEIVAFANGSGGTMLVGVTDEGEVQGMSPPRLHAVERLVVEVCADAVKPPVRVEVHRHELDGRSFLLVDVPEGDAQHEAPGGAFIRLGSTKRPMGPEERVRLAQRRGLARSLGYDERTVPGTGIGSFDERLWRRLLSAEALRAPEVGLEKLGLLAADEQGVVRATVAGVLLCAEEPHVFLRNACITAVRYRGADPSTGQIDAREIQGPIDRQISGALTFVEGNMRVGARKDPARVDLPQYSLQAVFEALVNAVVHRDYSIAGSRIRLRMFSDRLEVCSPGSLPNNLTVESMSARQSTRNEVLVSALGRLPVGELSGAGSRSYFLERRGDGVPIIERETRQLAGKPPEFRLVDRTELQVVIPAAATDSAGASVVVTARCDGIPLQDADVLALFPNSTWKRAATDGWGEAPIQLHSVHLPMTVFVAAEGCGAHVESEWVPADGPLTVELEPLPEGGSVLFPEASGRIPGLSGGLNLGLDSHGRTYFYASNIAVNDGQLQPVTFTPGSEELRLTDAEGVTIKARVAAVIGRSSILEYRPA